jgi:hypothetical protein
LTGLPESILIFLKNQNNIILVKKQKSPGCNWVFDQVLPGQMGRRVTLGFNFLYSFLNLVQFQPRIGRVLDSRLTRWAKLDFKTMIQTPIQLGTFS